MNHKVSDRGGKDHHDWYILFTMLIVGPSRNSLLIKKYFVNMSTRTYKMSYKDIWTHTNDLDSKTFVIIIIIITCDM